MNLWTTTFLGNSLFDWLVAVIVALILYSLLRLLAWLLQKSIKRQRTQPPAGANLLIKGLLDHTLWLFLAWMAIVAGLRFLILSLAVIPIINTVTIIIVLVQLGIWIIEIVEYWVSRRFIVREGEVTYKKGPYMAVMLLSRVVVWTLVIVLVLENIPGIHITTLIASLGIGGIAIGLALQRVLGDLFASLTISIDQPFIEGDAINVDEFSGQVEHIGLKSTRVRSDSGEQLIFSNSDLLNSRIRNFKSMQHRPVVFTLHITYQTSHKKLQKIPEIVKEIIEDQSKVTFNGAHFKSYEDSSLAFEISYTIDTAAFDLYLDIQEKINLEIFRRFHDEGIDFAYPTQTILLEKQS